MAKPIKGWAKLQSALSTFEEAVENRTSALNEVTPANDAHEEGVADRVGMLDTIQSAIDELRDAVSEWEAWTPEA